jgi:cell division transport system permease protein
MQIMETFGAPMMLRSGVLFRVAFVDAIFATIFVSILFFYIKYSWASQSGIDMIVKNRDVLFQASDIMVLFISAIVIVILAVYSVVFSSKGVED